MDIKLIYRIHKWLAAVVAIVTVGWFVSGALMVMPDRWFTLSPNIATGPDAEARLSGAPEFGAAGIAPSAAIAAVDAAVGRRVVVTSMKLRRLPGRLVYEVSTEQHGSRLVDAIDGTIVTVTEDLARQIVARTLGSEIGLGPITQQTDRTLAFGGPLPAYRIPALDGKGTVCYVDGTTAELHVTDRLSRAAGLVMGLHGLWFLRLLFPGNAVRALMLALAITGTAMSLAGTVILLAQVRRWWAQRRRHGRADVVGPAS